jgi:cytochrome c-type biogenesis protein CcmE
MSRKLLAATVLLGAGILVAVFSSSRRTSIYSRSVSEFRAHPVLDEPVRVLGALVPGSLVRQATPCEYRFVLAEAWSLTTRARPSGTASQLSVHYPKCVLPDTLREVAGIETVITVEGELCTSCQQFEASQIFVKAPWKYELQEMRRGNDASAAPVGL